MSMYEPNMAATIFSSAIFTIFLALTSAILSGNYHDSSAICKGFIGKQFCFDLIVNRRKLHRYHQDHQITATCSMVQCGD